jgi:hypothetical protein
MMEQREACTAALQKQFLNLRLVPPNPLSHGQTMTGFRIFFREQTIK